MCWDYVNVKNKVGSVKEIMNWDDNYAVQYTTGFAGVTKKGYAVPADYTTFPPEESP